MFSVGLLMFGEFISSIRFVRELADWYTDGVTGLDEAPSEMRD